MSHPNPCMLIILDGYGLRDSKKFNAVYEAHTPNLSKLFQKGGYSILEASGEWVGLPKGQIGNSEVGHLHLGSGRVSLQGLSLIERTLAEDHSIDRLFHDHPAFKELKVLHLLGILSPGGVHGHEDHLLRLVQYFAHHGVARIYLHGILDGRDTPPKSALASLKKVQETLESIRGKASVEARIATLIGRFYAMDRDQRWDRTEIAYRLLLEGKATLFSEDPEAALQQAYEEGKTDEFCPGLLCTPFDQWKPEAGHGFLFVNFRADRAKQLSQALALDDFSAFERPHAPLPFLALTEYSPELRPFALLPQEKLHDTLGEVISKAGFPQLHLSETEKFAHVTFFFNGNRHHPWPGEVQTLVPSVREVATYDLAPAMQSQAIAQKAEEALRSQAYPFILVNFPNPDMVGHTGNYPATLEALNLMDRALGKLFSAVEETGAQLLLTSDHGNAELMFDEVKNQPHTAHTTSPVPCFYLGPKQLSLRPKGSLIDVAPTLLQLLELPIPQTMTGKSLVA